MFSMVSIFASTKAPCVYTAYRYFFRLFPSYELSFATLVAKVGRLGEDNNCVRHTDRHIHTHYVNSYIDYQ